MKTESEEAGLALQKKKQVLTVTRKVMSEDSLKKDMDAIQYSNIKKKKVLIEESSADKMEGDISYDDDTLLDVSHSDV